MMVNIQYVAAYRKLMQITHAPSFIAWNYTWSLNIPQNVKNFNLWQVCNCGAKG